GIACTPALKNIYEKMVEFADVRQEAEHESDWGWGLGRAQYPEITLNERAVTDQAKAADVAVFTITRQAGEGWDRSAGGDKGFNLTADEQRLLERVSDKFHKEGKKVIVVINSGSVINTSSWKGLVDGILLAWQPGEEAGHCVADIVTGKVNPSGKLPMTWPNDLMDHPSSKQFPTTAPDNDKVCRYKEGINVGYRYFETAGKAVSYPFGYGLSYTTFSYRDLKVKASGKGFTAQVTVINTGRVAGKEAVQLYVTAPKGSIEKPAIELKAFGKTRLLQPGEKQTLTFTVSDYDLASFHEAGSEWVADAGTYTVKAGAAVDDIRAHATYKLKKAFTQKVTDVLHPKQAL
ncbi:MAG: glycoside hydrolase family 3 C-terminal domain-containing protein, partial [Prevotellaceae bacterium]|nr:glycoside hydrolase family 3 C-terminal domain-containing protein [Prevotellaceae bacterium]